MKIVIPGGSGQVGTILARAFHANRHEEADFVRAIYWLIENEAIEGAINLASPNPLPNAHFMRVIRRAWGMPIGLPATKWMLEIGAFLLGTETELILKSWRVVPGRLLKQGLTFQFPTWPEAAWDPCRQWREPSPP